MPGALSARAALSCLRAACSLMLAFAIPGRHALMVHTAARGPSPSGSLYLLSRHGHDRMTGASRRLLYKQINPQLCSISSEASRRRHQHQRQATRTVSFGANAPTSSQLIAACRSGFTTELKAKGVDTSSPRPAASDKHPSPDDAAATEIVAGTRVRLRDTGRLGTVVGKKQGGWWVVDLLESWEGARTKKAPRRSSKVGRDGGGGVASRATSGGTKSGSGREGTSRKASTIASGGPVSTRKVNMEPLGAAYAPLGVALEAAAGATRSGKLRYADSTSSSKSGVVQQKVEKEIARRKGTWSEIIGGEIGSTDPASARSGAVKNAVSAWPSALVGQTISIDMSGESAPATEGDADAIRTMRVDGLPHAQMKEWLVFSDLHVSPGSLAVCLEVLDRVNAEAMRREACGIAFLGDFWHARGSLKVDLLVPVMKRLATWTRPVVMIPGNHDQVTLGGGVHALTPLQFAFADPKQALVLSEPTLFLNALWIPHRRNNSVVETLLASEEARGARAIFCHVDIKGAAMNDGMVSHAGIPRSAFPDGVPSFSGHFHKPHTVGNGFIRFVGSPYQTCLAESGQTKALLVLDAASWEEIESIPLHIGRRFFRIKGDDQPLPDADAGEASPGDRVVWTVKDAGSEDVKRRAEALRQAMVEVEIREIPRPFPTMLPTGVTGIAGRGQGANANETVQDAKVAAAAAADSWSLSPEALFRAYLERERKGGRNISDEVERLGFDLIETLEQQAPSKGKEKVQEDRHTSLALHSIQLKNFGPFRDEVTYPLDERGVVLLRGSNLDDSGADSNGAGKTTLAMSALWALAGVFDARPVSDGRVADVVHEGTRGSSSSSVRSRSRSFNGSNEDGVGGGSARSTLTVAEATLTGTLNGKPLWLQRRKGVRVNQLFLKHDGKDLTRQVAKETQVVLEEELGLSPHVLARGIFQGQHHVNGLLESTDAQLKEELALLVPMDTWQDLASQSRAKARKSDENAARFRERAVTRREDLARLTQELERVEAEVATSRTINSTFKSTSNVTNTINSLNAGAANASVTVERTDDSQRGLAQHPDATRPGDAAVQQALISSPTGRSISSDRYRGPEGGMPKTGDPEVVEQRQAGLLKATEEAGRASKEARRVTRRAREDAESEEEALRLLRTELEGVVEAWTNRKMSLLGEAKAARERVSFARRDADLAENRLRDAERAAARAGGDSTLLRERDPDLWDIVLGRTAAIINYGDTSNINDGDTNDDGDEKVSALESELESAETITATTRSALADAEAALRHASEAVQAHAGMERLGEGACHACGQPVTGTIIYERGEILQVSLNAAAAEVERLRSEDATNERMLAAIRARSDLLGRMVRASSEADQAHQKFEEFEGELRARREDLRRVEEEATAAEREVEELARREAAARREWSTKMKAAEWALKAHRDKQIFAQHELEETLAREADLHLQFQAQQAKQERLLQAQESVRARVREIEAAVDRVRGELEKFEEKERNASSLKVSSNALAEHLGVRGVQNFVFRDAANQLQANVARYLHALSDGALLLHLSMEGDRVVKRASARASDGGFRDRSLSQLSGGQWRRASLALELAFADLARQRSRFSCNLLVLDEVLSQLDSSGRARVANMLRALAHGRVAEDDSGVALMGATYSTILVILQDLPAEELQETFDRIDQIVKHRDSSTVVVDC